jgi:hypothetical protein
MVRPSLTLARLVSCSVVLCAYLAFTGNPALAIAASPPTGALAATGPHERPGVLASAPGDRSATQTLLDAEYKLERAIVAHSAAVEAAFDRAAGALGEECKGVLDGVPDQEVIEEEGPSTPGPKLSGRVQGERARSEQEKQTIELEIDERISAPAYRVLRPPYEAFISEANGLIWSNPTIEALVHQKTARLREDLAGPPVGVCAEMRSWAASGFHVLPPASKSLRESREAWNKQVVQGNLEVLLRPYEGPAQRATIRRTEALEERLREHERTDERFERAEAHMETTLGEKLSRRAERQSAPVIARGRTSAGTTFVVRRSVGRSFSGSCTHEVEVEVHEGNGGQSGGICLSEGAHSRLSGSCSGSVETVELATPANVRRARVRFNDGRTVTVSVIEIPAKDGGPAGVFIDAFRGYERYPVSLKELDRDGRVLQTVGLGPLHCTKKSAEEGPSGPQFVTLATTVAPGGEALTIQGTLLRFGGKTEFSLGPQPGTRNTETREERTKPGPFRWELSSECAPHPYSLLAGILLTPGASVLVRTPAGLIPLTKVELAASLHAEGPLFYGVYATPPTEIVVEGADGSVLHSESLAAKATEETEFCEGYAEG